MKMEFDNLSSQMMYISRFVRKYTDIEKKCQVCGAPADIRHNINNPYEIQLICSSCRKNKFNNRRGILNDIPTINVYDHITNPRIKIKFFTKDCELVKKLEYVLNLSYCTKQQARSIFNNSYIMFEKTIDYYEKNIDKDIRSKLDLLFKKSRAIAVRKVKQRQSLEKNHNNLSKIKYDLGITNRDIEKLSNYKIEAPSISLICNNKVKPTIKTKCLLAKTLNLYVSDIFPEDFMYSKVNSLEDIYKLQKSIKIKLIKHLKDLKNEKSYNYIKRFISNNNLKITEDKIYRFIKNDALLTHDEYVQLYNLYK